MAIILLRGLGREQAHWHDFPLLLKASLIKNCVVESVDISCPDCLGCGEYYKAQAPTTITAYTDHIRVQLSSETVVDGHCLIAISMGGMIALDWAKRFPDEVSKVVLINSSSASSPPWLRFRASIWPLMLIALLLPSVMRERFILATVSNLKAANQHSLNAWQQIQKLRPVRRRTLIRMGLAAAKFHLPHGVSDKQSFLVLTSTKDRLVSPSCSDVIASTINSVVKQHDHAGHDLPLDDPEWLVDTIVGWLREQRLKNVA